MNKREWKVCILSVCATLAAVTLLNAGGEVKTTSPKEFPKQTIRFVKKDLPVIDMLDYAEEVEAGTKKVIEVATDYDDIEIIATVVAAEAGNQPMVGKVAVAATILNRAETWHKSVYSVVTQKNQYAYPYSGKVSDECYEAVNIAIKNRKLFPKNMLYFRTKYYHTFGEPYIQIGDHYFSLEAEQ